MLDKSNRIVHGMWIGTTLSRLELLTVHSFLEHGHEFHLWAYDDVSRAGLPAATRIRDASQILPRSAIFVKHDRDQRTGVGLGSLGLFSDLFRYKLLAQHGGIWVDMDVTCLRPFDFRGAYAFRPHRFGVVGSIMKCPRAGAFMRDVYKETSKAVTGEVEYLAANLILSRHVTRRGLEDFIVADMTNVDDWNTWIKPLVERPVELPTAWYGIHWINEMWRTLREDGGFYRGVRYIDYLPDKDNPREGSTLWELYRRFGLIERRAGTSPRAARPRPFGRTATSIPVAQVGDDHRLFNNINIIVPSLARNGNARIAKETAEALASLPGNRVRLFVKNHVRRGFTITKSDHLSVTVGQAGRAAASVVRSFGVEMLGGGLPLTYTLAVPHSDLVVLWEMGISTIPLIRDTRSGWTEDPARYAVPAVPLLFAASNAVAAELRKAVPGKPVLTIRHELQQRFVVEDLAKRRRHIRDHYGIPDDVVLVGMVGHFTAARSYVRAVQVLARLRDQVPAKLMILGGWDDSCGGSRDAYEAMCRRALDLGLIADVLAIGDVVNVEQFLPAFDVVLDTSPVQGFSVALLEARQAGCPIVAAQTGGTPEAHPPGVPLVSDPADIDGYVRAIVSTIANPQRYVPAPPDEPLLVAQLWTLAARFGSGWSLPTSGMAKTVLFVADHLLPNADNSLLVTLMTGLGRTRNVVLALLANRVDPGLKLQLDEACIQIVIAQGPGTVEAASAILRSRERLGAGAVCFWGVRAEIKFAVAKILSITNVRLFDITSRAEKCAIDVPPVLMQHRLALTREEYLARLDGIVAFRPVKRLRAIPRALRHRILWIPGVAQPQPTFIPLPPGEHVSADPVSGRHVIGTASRISAHTRADVIFEMYEALSEERADVSLLVVGTPHADSDDERAANQVRVSCASLARASFAENQDYLLPFVRGFGLFVTACVDDSAVQPALEAMSLGIPVVTLAGTPTADLIEDGITGCVVRSAPQMSRRILELLRRARTRARLGRAARERALELHSEQRVVDACATLFFQDRARHRSAQRIRTAGR